jgi:ribosome maturation factor RimP
MCMSCCVDINDMSKKKKVFLESNDILWDALSSIAKDEGLEVYDIERIANGGIRVFVDLPLDFSVSNSSKTGVTSDDCSRLCKRLMVFFSVEATKYGFGQDPEIEVSSPGINRHLRLKSHFVRAVGARVKLKIVEQGDSNQPKTRIIVGKLEEINESDLDLMDEETKQRLNLPFLSVREARVDFQF